MEYCSAIKKNEMEKKKRKKEWNDAICSNTDGPREHPNEWNKSDRERQISYDIIYMWNLKKKKQYKWTY